MSAASFAYYSAGAMDERRWVLYTLVVLPAPFSFYTLLAEPSLFTVQSGDMDEPRWVLRRYHSYHSSNYSYATPITPLV